MAIAFREMMSELKTELERYGIKKATIKPGGKHPKLCFMYQGRKHERPISSTPANHHTVRIEVARLRRYLGERPDGGTFYVGVSVYNRKSSGSPGINRAIRLAIDHELLIHLYGQEIPEEVRLTVLPIEHPFGIKLIKERGNRGNKLSINHLHGVKKTTRDLGQVGALRLNADNFKIKRTVFTKTVPFIAKPSTGGSVSVLLPPDWQLVDRGDSTLNEVLGEPDFYDETRSMEGNGRDRDESVSSERFLDVHEISVRTGLAPSTISNRARLGSFPAPNKNVGADRKRLWPEDEVDRWLKKNVGKIKPRSSRSKRSALSTLRSVPTGDDTDQLKAATELLNELLDTNRDVQPKVRDGHVILVRLVEEEL